MHDDRDFTDSPQRRLGNLALYLHPEDISEDVPAEERRVLLVCKKYQQEKGELRPWGLPGGCATTNEPADAALLREVHDELGIGAQLGRILVVHQMPESEDSTEGINLVWECAPIPDSTVIRLPQDELSAWAYVPMKDLDEYVKPHTRIRIEAAVDVANGTAPGAVFLHGYPDVA
ncbi:NUDIX domain-containing protein [Streptomyces sp. NPDC058045]|uniref:NUDIX domain-containing protein n=1 Tax=Streptomyces sp. NPDC058045 TaxID=3346311 RepID=UPI0036EAECA6